MTEQAPGGEAREAPAPKLGTPEYDQAMAAKFRAARDSSVTESPLAKLTTDPTPAQKAAEPVVEASAKGARPEDVPEKFWDAQKGSINTDALLKSYTELEKRGSAPKEVASVQADEAAEAAVEAAGLDFGELHNKIIANGTLDETDYKALAGTGIDKDIVDSYVELVSYKAAAEAEKAVAYIGGKEASDKLITWAAANLKESEKVQYNTLLAGPDWRVAVDALKARQAASSPTRGNPTLATGGGGAASGVVGYATRADMTAAMSDPRYHNRTSVGEAYRAEVYRKAAVSAWNLK